MLHIILSTQNLSNLRKLDLSGHLIASSLAEFNRQLEKLGHATNLRELIIEGCQVNHTEFLKSLHLLCVLNLSITRITEEDLQYIAHCASLKYLYLSFNPLSEQSKFERFCVLKIICSINAIDFNSHQNVQISILYF
jgi:Leucine-rich repeat (LRR) protein